MSWFLDKILNWFILALAAAEIGLMIQSYREMTVLKKRIDKLNESTAGSPVLTEAGQGKVTAEYKVTIGKDWQEFDKFCDDYQKESVLFSWYSLIIQIFPLLGILGTVTGLFIAMSSNSDWSNAQALFEGVRFALSSTVLGIFFAVVFKVADISFSARYLNYIDDGIARFRENFNAVQTFPRGGEEK